MLLTAGIKLSPTSKQFRINTMQHAFTTPNISPNTLLRPPNIFVRAMLSNNLDKIAIIIFSTINTKTAEITTIIICPRLEPAIAPTVSSLVKSTFVFENTTLTICLTIPFSSNPLIPSMIWSTLSNEAIVREKNSFDEDKLSAIFPPISEEKS